MARALGLGTLMLLGGRAAAADDVVRLRPIVVDAVPRGIASLPVDLPETLAPGAADSVRWTVRLLGAAALVGRTEGTLPVSGTAPRNLLLALRIPADMPAGEVLVAEVEFRAAGHDVHVQPIMARIPAQRRLEVTGAPLVEGLRTGDRVELAFRVANSGNTAESLRVAIRVPHGWTVRTSAPTAVTLDRRAEIELVANVVVSPVAGIGDHAVEIALHEPAFDGAPVASYRTILRVTEDASVTRGLLLTPIVAAATGSAGSATFLGATLDGPVREDVHVRARVLPPARRTGIVNQGFTAVGAFGTPLSVTVTGRDWEVAAGNAMSRFSDLAGVNIIGEGVTARGTHGAYEAQAMAARPSQALGASGRLLGAGLARDTEFGRFGGSATWLAERGGIAQGRELTAFAADWQSPAYGALSLTSGLAYRASHGAAGAGLSLGAVHERPGERAQVLVSHAPGGSAAFARATDELQVSVARQFTERWSVDAFMNRTRDQGNVFEALHVDAWNLGQRYALSPDATVSLRGQVSRFDARAIASSIGGFGAGERSVTAGYDRRSGLLLLGVEGSLGAVSRRTALLDGREVERVAAQQALRAFGSRAIPRWGAVDASLALQLTEAGLGFPRDAWQMSARWSGVPVEVAGHGVRLDNEIQYQRIGTLRSFVVTRTVVVVSLARGLELALSAERNPYFRDARGRAGWIAATRLSAAHRLVAPEALGEAGIVYEDRNRNGRRDADEPGVAGVAVRRGDARATTDRDGRYRLPSRTRGRTRVELGSLPAGLVAHPRLGADSLERREIPLLPTGSVRLVLRLVADDDGRMPDVALSDVTVTLQDATGFQWVGRRVDGAVVAYDDVPAGEYRVRLDFSRSREALRHDETVGVTVGPRMRHEVVVPLRGRTVRVITPPARSNGGGRGGVTRDGGTGSDLARDGDGR